MLHQYASSFIERHPAGAPPQVQSTLAKLSLCRTSALGVRKYVCQGCERESLIYNSCGDRHCPQCSGSRRADWLQSAETLLVPGVSVFQVVFTLPSELSRLALGNRKQIYDLLFTASWRALRETIEAEQGFDPAALMVLHTWNQKLEAHGHLHAVVPAGGPSLRHPDRWKPTTRRGEVNPYYLVDASRLRQMYRQRFLEGLRHVHARGALKLTGEFEYLRGTKEFENLLSKLSHVSWGLNIQPPPKTDLKPATMLKYLARYLTGGPISDGRLISDESGMVKFWTRQGTTVGGDRNSVPMRLSGTEFARRWSMHILPKGYVKTRRFGGWSNTRRKNYQQQCLDLRGTEPAIATPQDDASEPVYVPACPHCGEPLELTASDEKQSWHAIMNSQYRPRWYKDSG